MGIRKFKFVANTQLIPLCQYDQIFFFEKKLKNTQQNQESLNRKYAKTCLRRFLFYHYSDFLVSLEYEKSQKQSFGVHFLSRECLFFIKISFFNVCHYLDLLATIKELLLNSNSNFRILLSLRTDIMMQILDILNYEFCQFKLSNFETSRCKHYQDANK